MTAEGNPLVLARDALHRLCLERGSTDGYGDVFAAINEALASRPSPTADEVEALISAVARPRRGP